MAATISHSPRECRLALAGASGPVIIDLETTGIERSSRIVSAGILVDDHVFYFVPSLRARGNPERRRRPLPVVARPPGQSLLDPRVPQRLHSTLGTFIAKV